MQQFTVHVFVCYRIKMAEVVQRKLEAMLPELEELQRVGLFTRGEVQSVIRKRRTFEYRMLRRPADKEDFLHAIQVLVHCGRRTWSSVLGRAAYARMPLTLCSTS